MAKLLIHTPEQVAEYVSKGYWEEAVLADLCDRSAQRYPAREGLTDVTRGKRFTWSELKLLSDRLALALIGLGLKKDSVLVNQLPNWAETATVHFACDKAGIMHLGCRTSLRHSELEHLIRITEAQAAVIPWKFRDFDHFTMMEELRSKLPQLKYIIVVGEQIPQGAISFQELIARPLEKEPRSEERINERKIRFDEIGDLMTTTGTTGMPKVAAHSGAVFPAIGKQAVERYKLTKDDVILCCIPFWSGINGALMVPAIRAGARTVVIEEFGEPTEIFKAIEKEKVTATISAPTVYFRLLEHPDINHYDLSSLRFVVWSGAALEPVLARKMEDVLKCKVIGGYGVIEGAYLSTHSVDDSREVLFSTVGRIFDGLEVKVVDDSGSEVPRREVGEILARGATGYEGCYNDPGYNQKLFDKDGFFHTGDLGRVDERGNIALVGRKKDVIIRGGQNIYPVDIESMLLSHPHVSNAAVVGMPDPEMGEKACAFVIPKPGKKFTFDEMVSFLKEKKIASYKLPERLEIVDQFPIAGESKVSKKELKEMLVQKLKAEGKI